jgi:hypothetical protein
VLPLIDAVGAFFILKDGERTKNQNVYTPIAAAWHKSARLISSPFGVTDSDVKRKRRHSMIFNPILDGGRVSDCTNDGSRYATASATTTLSSLVAPLDRNRASKECIPPDELISSLRASASTLCVLSASRANLRKKKWQVSAKYTGISRYARLTKRVISAFS